MITPEQRYWWRIALELKLRKCSRDAFQDFFSKLMERLHGSDFIRVRAFGKLGDKGCDGYLQSTGKVFACYGAINGDGTGKVAYFVGKMGEIRLILSFSGYLRRLSRQLRHSSGGLGRGLISA
jgi:hypothetical protein